MQYAQFFGPFPITFRRFISILFNPRFKHDISRLFIIFKSKFVHDETVNGITNVVDIMSLLYDVA